MMLWQNKTDLVYARHEMVGKERQFPMVILANPKSFQTIRAFVSREFDTSLLNSIPQGTPVNAVLESSEYNGRTSYNLLGMTPIKQ